jgi:hypothetical protein
MILIPLSIEKCVFACRFGATALPSDFLRPLETVIREPALYKLLTFHNPNPNLMSYLYADVFLSVEELSSRVGVFSSLLLSGIQKRTNFKPPETR